MILDDYTLSLISIKFINLTVRHTMPVVTRSRARLLDDIYKANQTKHQIKQPPLPLAFYLSGLWIAYNIITFIICIVFVGAVKGVIPILCTSGFIFLLLTGLVIYSARPPLPEIYIFTFLIMIIISLVEDVYLLCILIHLNGK